jgi:hypothetical protein
LQRVVEHSAVDEFKLPPGQFIHGYISQNDGRNTTSICGCRFCLLIY